MKNFLKHIEWLSLFLYGAFGFILGISGVTVTENTLNFLALVGILVVIDVRSYTKGLDKGADIVKTVWELK